jgi:hypothetical protein
MNDERTVSHKIYNLGSTSSDATEAEWKEPTSCY